MVLVLPMWERLHGACHFAPRRPLVGQTSEVFETSEVCSLEFGHGRIVNGRRQAMCQREQMMTPLAGQ
jgi:hypothetical protein